MAGSMFDKVRYENRTFPAAMQRAADAFGNRRFLAAPGGALTFGDTVTASATVARGLHDLGVAPRQNVALFMGNRVELPLGWWATTWLGGVAVLIHSAYRDSFLARAIDFCDARVLIVDADLLPEVARVAESLTKLRSIIVAGEGEWKPWDGPEFISWNSLNALPPITSRDVLPSDPATIMYTSGTTGPSKAVVKSHHYEFVYAAFTIRAAQLDETSHIWSCLPATHVTTANSGIYAGLLSGAAVVLSGRFSARSFWSEAHEHGATHAYSLGAMANILMKQEPSELDRQHGVRVVAAVPPPFDPAEFERRFAVKLISQGYGMTEVYPIPHALTAQDWTRPHNFIGRPDEDFEIRIADANGSPVQGDGASKGEILVRPRLPGYMMSGYYNDPEATLTACRDLWFHTGDLATIDSEGFLYYHGRTADSIRRRGENISIYELEQVVMSYPAVKEAVAFGVPSDVGEEDVKIDVVWAESAAPELKSPAALIEYLTPRLPFFMLPRYVQVRKELPKTPSQKVQKYELRAEGITPDVFDRDVRRVARSRA